MTIKELERWRIKWLVICTTIQLSLLIGPTLALRIWWPEFLEAMPMFGMFLGFSIGGSTFWWMRKLNKRYCAKMETILMKEEMNRTKGFN